MNETTNAPATDRTMDRDEMHSALFAQMVLQQANMAMMLLGKVPHPQSGEMIRDVEAAGMFIDQLEMLEAKTRGNLTPDEERVLKQSLMSLRMAFVEVVEASPGSEGARAPSTAPNPAATEVGSKGTGEQAAGPESAPPTPPVEEESKKKFTKKY